MKIELSDREVELVLQAVDFIEQGRCLCSCAALAMAEGFYMHDYSLIAQKMSGFYDKHREFSWFDDVTQTEAKLARQTMLLFFAEVCKGEGIEL